MTQSPTTYRVDDWVVHYISQKHKLFLPLFFKCSLFSFARETLDNFVKVWQNIASSEAGGHICDGSWKEQIQWLTIRNRIQIFWVLYGEQLSIPLPFKITPRSVTY